MALAVMLAGMITVVNLTMLGAVAQLLSAVPDKSFSAIVAKWFAGKKAKLEQKANPLVEVDKAMKKGRRLLLFVIIFLALAGLGLILFVYLPGSDFGLPWAIILFAFCGNVTVVRAYLGSLRRRVEKIMYSSQ